MPTDPSCLKPVQSCSWVNSVYRSAPAPPPLPAGSTSKAVAIQVTWQALAAPSRYGQTGPQLTPLLPFDRSSIQLLPNAAGPGTPTAQPSLSPHLPPVEQKRRRMQSSLATGWATWVFDDLLALASLPVRSPKLTVGFSQSSYILMTYRVVAECRDRPPCDLLEEKCNPLP